MSSSSCGVRPPASSKVVVLLFIMTVGRLRAVMGIAIRAAAMPGQRRLVYLCAVLVGAETGLGDQAGRHRRPAPPPGRHVSLSERGRLRDDAHRHATHLQDRPRRPGWSPPWRRLCLVPVRGSPSAGTSCGRSMRTPAPGRRSSSRSTSCAGAFGSPSATFLPPGAPGGLMKPQVQAGRPPLPRTGRGSASIMSSSWMAPRRPSAASRMSPRTCVPAARAARTLTACSQPPLELRHNVARTSPFICCVIARQSAGCPGGKNGASGDAHLVPGFSYRLQE